MPTENLIRVRLGFDERVEPIALRAGFHNKIVVARPQLIEYAVASGFARESAFPGPGLIAGLKGIQEAVDGTSAQAAFFGHCDDSGSDDVNKKLSERRARAMRALFTSDVEELQTVACDNAWDVPEFQAMLRSLGYVAGPIDGEIGPMTQAAIEAFSVEHGHREHPSTPTPTNGPELDAATRDSIVAAYTREYGLEMPLDALLGPGAVGCASFNSHAFDPVRARRVSLTVLENAKDQPPSGAFPCTSDDASACLVDRNDTPRCRFYRTFVYPRPAQPELAFFDFRWTRTPNGKIHLSALCNAPDTDAVTFHIGIARQGLHLPPPNSTSGSTRPTVKPLSELQGYVRHGICYALWDPEDFDPFDVRQWSETADESDEDEVEAFPVPTFEIVLGDHWAYATPPGRPLHRIVLERNHTELVALLSDGSFARITSEDPRLDNDFDPNLHAVAIFPSGALLKGPQS